jgi:hypothetical protein
MCAAGRRSPMIMLTVEHTRDRYGVLRTGKWSSGARLPPPPGTTDQVFDLLAAGLSGSGSTRFSRDFASQMRPYLPSPPPALPARPEQVSCSPGAVARSPCQHPNGSPQRVEYRGTARSWPRGSTWRWGAGPIKSGGTGVEYLGPTADDLYWLLFVEPTEKLSPRCRLQWIGGLHGAYAPERQRLTCGGHPVDAAAG